MKKSSHPQDPGSRAPIEHWRISMVENAKGISTREIDFIEIISWIRSGKWREPIEQIRAEFSNVLSKSGDVAAAKGAVRALKEKLPAAMPSGHFSSRRKPTTQRLLSHSGLLCADLDDLGSRLAQVGATLATSPHLWAKFVSPTGNGLKCIFRVPADVGKHAASFRAVGQHVLDLTGEKIDPACSDPARLCFVSFDPDASLNPKAVELTLLPIPLRLHSASVSCEAGSLDNCVPASLPSCVSASLHNNSASILRNISKRSEALSRLERENPALARLYKSQIETRFMAIPHGRNAFLVQAVPFLYRAVAEPLIPLLTGHFYDCNGALFHDSREDHMKETEAMIQNVASTYLASLSAAEREIYQTLPPGPEQDTFRICRDLAMLPGQPREPLTFFLSFDNLGLRLGKQPTQAQRIMRQMEGHGLLKLLKKGNRRKPGVKAVAGTYLWLLIPQQGTQAVDSGEKP